MRKVPLISQDLIKVGKSIASFLRKWTGNQSIRNWGVAIRRMIAEYRAVVGTTSTSRNKRNLRAAALAPSFLQEAGLYIFSGFHTCRTRLGSVARRATGIGAD